MIKHRYEHQIDPNGGSAAARLARMVQPGQRVLELGTGPGTVTRILHEKGCRITGVELDASAAELCAPFCERMVLGNLEDSAWQQGLQGERFDVVICADVLEHLRDPRALLEILPGFLEAEGSILLSLPNAGHLSVLASLLAGRFAYQDKGLLDNTHLRFFGREDIEQMLAACGLLWVQWETVEVPPEQAELKHFWHRLTPEEQALLRERSQEGLVYQHVVRIRPASESGQLQRLAHSMGQQQEQMDQLQQQHQLALQAVQDARAQERLAGEAREASWQAERLALQREKEALARELRQQQDHSRALQQSMDAVQRSHSWRLTAPLRDLGRWLRGRP